MTCTKCHKHPIYNKFYKLCKICNHLRLNENKPRKEYKQPKPKAVKVSNKSKEHRNRKSEFRKQILSSRPNWCAGCNLTTHLTVSHTIPVSIRKDLEFEQDNVHLECLSCHNVWEHGNNEQRSSLLNFKDKIDYIKKVDPYYYERKFGN